jgi:hypothetical protein
VYLLQRLAYTQAFNLLQDEELHCDDLLQQLFETLFNAAHLNHNGAVRAMMVKMLADLCSEYEDAPMSAPLLDSILANLLEPKRTEAPAAYALAKELVADHGTVGGVLHAPLQTFLQSCLPNSLVASEEGKESEYRSEWRELVIELTSITTEATSTILPQLVDVAKMDSEATRTDALELLARLLALEECDVAKEVPALLDEAFLRRLIDVSTEVRVMAVKETVPLLEQKPALRATLIEHLLPRARDAKDKVREAFVTAVCDAALETALEAPDLATYAPLLEDVAHRMLDTNKAIGKAARDGLCDVYRKAATAHLKAHPSAYDVPQALHVVPQRLLSAYATEAAKSPESRLEIEMLLTNKLLPPDEGLRLRSVCALHRTLLATAASRRAFRSMMRGKKIVQAEVMRWTELQRAATAKEASDEAKEAAAQEQAALVLKMSSRLPLQDKVREVWAQLAECKDKNVAKHLGLLASPGSSYAEVLAGAKALKQSVADRLTDKQKPHLDAILTLTANTLLWRSGAESLLEGVADELPEDASDRARPTLELLLDVCLYAPQVFASAGAPLGRALVAAARSSEGDGARDAAPPAKPGEPLPLLLRLVQAASPQLRDAAPSVRKQLCGELCKLCCVAKDALVGKLAAQAISTDLLVPAVREQTFCVLRSKLLPHLDLAKPTAAQLCALSVLGALAKREPEALGDDAARDGLLRKLREAALPTPSASGSKIAPPKGKHAALPMPEIARRCEAQSLVLKLLANELLGSAHALHSDGSAAKDKEDGFSGDSANAAGGCAGLPPAPPAPLALPRLLDLIRRLSMALEAEGAVGVAEAADEIAHGKLRLACGKALLKLLRVCPYKVENTLRAPGVHKLALLMHDGIPQVRAAFGKKLAAEAMRGFQTDKKETKLGAPARYLSTRTKNLPPQYITWLALAAVDPLPGLQQFARERLVHLAAVWRSTAERQKNPRGLPETQLPWLVHVLAHHPDFEMEERALDAEEDEEDEESEGSVTKQSGTMPTAQRCLDFYINGCLAKSVNSFDLLREVCAKVRTAVDRLEPNGPQTRMVAAIARALIDFRAERSRNAMVSPVPPQLGLPSLLFFRPSEGHPLHADADHLPLGSAFQFIDGLKDTPKPFTQAAGPAAGVSGALIVTGKRSSSGGSNEQRRTSSGSGSGSASAGKGKAAGRASPRKAGAAKAGAKRKTSADGQPAKKKKVTEDEEGEGDDDDDDDDDDDSEDSEDDDEEEAKARADAVQQKAERQARLARREGLATLMPPSATEPAAPPPKKKAAPAPQALKALPAPKETPAIAPAAAPSKADGAKEARRKRAAPGEAEASRKEAPKAAPKAAAAADPFSFAENDGPNQAKRPSLRGR